MSLTNLKVLIVEDEALVAMMVEDLLIDLGCEVAGVAASVAAAIELIDDPGRQIDAAILDVNLGRETAYPVAERLASRGVPFAFATGYGASGVIPKFAAVPILVKPFADEELQRVVQLLAEAGKG
jgi:CheY-like chemotaxis protein